MKINRIQITDFQILKHVEIEAATPALLICGPNSQGKSSIGDAIRLALTGESTRVEHKKDWSKLVRVDAPKGAKILVGPQHSALIRLIHQLAVAGAIETAVVMTLKKPPARLPANWSRVWVEAGEIVRGETEKVAA